ncbi:unnamed protein product [Rotaria sordida]|uniref:Hepatitis TT virus Orf2/Gyrovirus Vp2 N-terminal domain-containing protein n=1 Tax=Rotaria sordida TaxID=392033 RepID=A0A815I0G5_9BILA|nr:unnamed protein product [Rotaria sordida]CAF1270133.1 unnamed protein product [Rotaria sordida]CAF1359840.1 unnamed protein product [Rotaria sordida]CAF1549525.1 unnamed protein product [Rotaria sordida]CAF3581471.1 unnamed protein product [Rotaria sordida]
MALAMHTTLTVSCEASQEQSGPTLVHSTGVQSYRVQPEIIRILQESCSNEKLCDHEQGVQCTDPPAHIVDAFKRAGFSVTSQSTSGNRKLWMLTKTGDSNSKQPTHKDEEEEEKEEEEKDEEEQ